MRARRATAKDAYVLDISLREIEPRIWRSVTVGADTTLHKLHWVIQMAMGWTNSHLHQFVVGNECYSQPEHAPDFEIGNLDRDGSVAERPTVIEAIERIGRRAGYRIQRSRLTVFGDAAGHQLTSRLGRSPREADLRRAETPVAEAMR